MRRAPKSGPRRLVDVVKCLVVGVLAFLVVGTASAQTGEGTADSALPPVAALAHFDELMEQHDCSATGFGPDVIPGSALVLLGGSVELVSFDDGWAVYTGARPGELMAVCRGDV